MSQLRLEAIEKRLRGKVVLADVSLEVADGEFCVLLGASGSGKSTLLNIIAGLDRPDGGRILIDDQDLTHASPKTRDVAMVFQSYALYPNLSVAENIAFPLRARGVSRRQADLRVAEVAEKMRLFGLLDRKPAQLSGGQQQRVAIGRALARTSSLFLLDEPLSSLDATLRAELRSEIRRLHRSERRTSIYVTHDQIEAMTLADRIAVLDEGRILQYAPPQVVYERPANQRVARMVGAREMNFIDGLIHLSQGEACFGPGSGSWSIPLRLPVEKIEDGQPAVIGFRPEHGTLLPAWANEGVPARIATLESTGPDTYVTAWADGQELSVRVQQGFKVTPNESVRISASPAVLNLFCAQGSRIDLN